MFEELHNEQWTVRAYIGKELSYKYQAMLHTVLELKAVVVSDTGFSYTQKISEAQSHYTREDQQYYHLIQLFSALRIQCNHAVHQLTDSSIAAPAHTVIISLYLSSCTSRALLSLPLTWKHTRHLKAPDNSNFTCPFLTNMELKLADHALPCVPNPLHRRVCTMAAFSTSNMQRSTAIARRVWSNGWRKESMRWANIYKPPRCERARWRLCGPDCFEFSVWCVLLRIESPPPSLSCQILPLPPPAPLPPSAINNWSYSIMRRFKKKYKQKVRCTYSSLKQTHIRFNRVFKPFNKHQS